MTSLQTLILMYTRFSGTLPPALSSMTSLTWLEVLGNQLVGAIPAELGAMRSLQTLSLSQNNFTGGVPASLASLTSLRQLDLSNNAFLNVGPLPTWLLNLTSLSDLNMEQTGLNGTLPAWLGQMRSLTFIEFRFNSLSGTIPASLGALTNMVYIYLMGNQLSGSIPPSLGSLQSLSTLELVSNQLSGTIPASLGALTALTDLDLGSNLLTGTIPASLAALTRLNFCRLDGNAFWCPLPAGLPSVCGTPACTPAFPSGHRRRQLLNAPPASLPSPSPSPLLLYQGWTSPVPGCATAGYNSLGTTGVGGNYPYNVGDTFPCRAWKLAATVCQSVPVVYPSSGDSYMVNGITGANNWFCAQSGRADAVFGTSCNVSSQYVCSDYYGNCNVNTGSFGTLLTVRNCAGIETAITEQSPPLPPSPGPSPPPLTFTCAAANNATECAALAGVFAAACGISNAVMDLGHERLVVRGRWRSHGLLLLFGRRLLGWRGHDP